jgi:hypothetical protein
MVYLKKVHIFKDCPYKNRRYETHNIRRGRNVLWEGGGGTAILLKLLSLYF